MFEKPGVKKKRSQDFQIYFSFIPSALVATAATGRKSCATPEIEGLGDTITEPFITFNNLQGVPVMIITGSENTMSDDLVLGRLLGRREAFNVVAARCSAAEAQTMREIRDQKLYLSHAKDWDEFCTNYFHTGKDNANRIIRLLEEFGPAYFEVAQLTRISAATYRAIAPSIDEQGLHHNGEAIALIPENAAKVAAAVSDLRKTVAIKAVDPKPEAPLADPLVLLDEECRDLSAKIEKTIPLAQDRRWHLRATVCRLRDRLSLLALKI